MEEKEILNAQPSENSEETAQRIENTEKESKSYKVKCTIVENSKLN